MFTCYNPDTQRERERERERCPQVQPQSLNPQEGFWLAPLWPDAQPWTNQWTKGGVSQGTWQLSLQHWGWRGKAEPRKTPACGKGLALIRALKSLPPPSLVSGFSEASCWLPSGSSLQVEDLHPRLASVPRRGDRKKPEPQHQIFCGQEHHLLPARRLCVRTNPFSCPWVSDALGPLPSALPTIRNMGHMTLPRARPLLTTYSPRVMAALG